MEPLAEYAVAADGQSFFTRDSGLAWVGGPDRHYRHAMKGRPAI
jgi:hypothetical protein